ncbi:hypothetical protein WAK64_06245 [Bacillus spongiae]|uniref:DUF3888 domain-containing protein n=1 Tax=Bacillus spongiae TaxID=2683610 RepID=A0ABU8HBR2_9BACI
MKRVSVFALVSLSLLTMVIFASQDKTNAEHKHNSIISEQSNDQFIMSLFQQEIQRAVANYYNEEVGTPGSIFIMYYWDHPDYHIIEVDQSEKGHLLEYTYNGKKQHYPYVVKFTVEPQKNGVLGTDTITFGIRPQSYTNDLEVNMLNYEHKSQ